MLKISLIILSLVALLGVGLSNNVFANNLPPTGGIAGSSSDNSNTAMGNSGTSDNGWNSGGQSSVPASNINGGTSEYNYNGGWGEPWHHHHYFGESSIDEKYFSPPYEPARHQDLEVLYYHHHPPPFQVGPDTEIYPGLAHAIKMWKNGEYDWQRPGYHFPDFSEPHHYHHPH